MRHNAERKQSSFQISMRWRWTACPHHTHFVRCDRRIVKRVSYSVSPKRTKQLLTARRMSSLSSASGKPQYSCRSNLPGRNSAFTQRSRAYIRYHMQQEKHIHRKSEDHRQDMQGAWSMENHKIAAISTRKTVRRKSPIKPDEANVGSNVEIDRRSGFPRFLPPRKTGVQANGSGVDGARPCHG